MGINILIWGVFVWIGHSVTHNSAADAAAHGSEARPPNNPYALSHLGGNSVEHVLPVNQGVEVSALRRPFAARCRAHRLCRQPRRIP
jgi:hypothetical protein